MKIRELLESDSKYLKWKRENVTIRGISTDEWSGINNGMALYGQGLYSAALSSKALAKQYGTVHFVVGAIPKKPKVVNSVNDAEIFIHTIIKDYCKANNMEYDSRYFYQNTSIENEMRRLGFDGLIIKGREMVNYDPPPNVKYFKNETQLIQYYELVVKD